MIQRINDFVSELDTKSIHPDRKNLLQEIIQYIFGKQNANHEIRLNFICTHNSRRSHFSQIWAQTMAHYYSVEKLVCYSGGTEATAIYPSVIKSLESVGFTIDALHHGNNPIYLISFDQNELPIVGFSKKFSHSFNPQSDFAAIMTCSDADKNCPVVQGAEKRISMPFEDPKKFDGSDMEAKKYEDKSIEIATEMKYIFEQVTMINE